MKGKLTPELLGTFFLVLTIGLTGNPLAIGAMLMVMVYAFGHYTGAHFNPAVTLAVYVRGKLDREQVVPYVVVQCVGAALAGATVAFLRGEFLEGGEVGGFAKLARILLVEVLLTFALATVVLNVATSKKTAGNSFYGAAIGMTVMAGAYAGGPISGGAFNPAVGLGVVIMSIGKSKLLTLLLWLVAVTAGSLAGGYLAGKVFRDLNPDDLS